MIDFAYTEEEQLLADTAKAFAQRDLHPHHREHEAKGPQAAITSAFEGTGLGILWDADAEDLPEGALIRCLVLEELGAGDASTALAFLLPAWARNTAEMLGVTAPLDQLAGLHLLEPGGTTTAKIPWLPLGEGSQLLVFSRDGHWSVRHIHAQPIASLGLGAARPSTIKMGAEVAAGAATENEAAHAVAALRLHISALLLGLARASYAYATTYMQQRQTFGKELVQHQGLAFMAAEIATEISAARCLLHRGALALDEGDPGMASHAYIAAVETALMTTDRGVQLLGGHGYMKDHPVEQWMRDARALSLPWGGVDAAMEDAATHAWEVPWS